MSTAALVLGELQTGSISPSMDLLLRQYYDVIGIGELEVELRERISAYLTRPRKSYQRMAQEIHTQLVKTHRPHMTEDEFDAFLKKRAPSHTYIWKFHRKEESVCIMYLNTIANFFDVRYLVTNFGVIETPLSGGDSSTKSS